MKNPRLMAAVAAILVLGGGSAAFLVWRAAEQRAIARADLLRVVDAELRGSDREAQRSALETVQAALVESTDYELYLAQARLLLALGRDQQAWDAVEVLATTPDGPIEARLIGAEVLAERYARSGDLQQGAQARGLAVQHAEVTGDPASRFLALQMSFRMGDVEAFAEDRAALLAEEFDSVERRTVLSCSPYLVALLADRSGVDLQPESLAKLAGGAGSRALLAGLALELDAGKQVEDREALLLLANEWESTPAELELLIAMAEIRSNDRGMLTDATLRLQSIIDGWPTSVDGRHAMVVASYGRGEQAGRGCQGHITWLLGHAPGEDLRRPIWQRLKLR